MELSLIHGLSGSIKCRTDDARSNPTPPVSFSTVLDITHAPLVLISPGLDIVNTRKVEIAGDENCDLLALVL
ncbi:hypothetical protein, partial [Xanthomonas axonopodis]|uniref:hypothetical protein n=1 Tax=Xanthomonas axonopodis TaxID=53413 RepID=UPI001BAFC8E3